MGRGVTWVIFGGVIPIRDCPKMITVSSSRERRQWYSTWPRVKWALARDSGVLLFFLSFGAVDDDVIGSNIVDLLGWKTSCRSMRPKPHTQNHRVFRIGSGAERGEVRSVRCTDSAWKLTEVEYIGRVAHVDVGTGLVRSSKLSTLVQVCCKAMSASLKRLNKSTLLSDVA